MDRRSFLAVAGASAAAGIGGCVGGIRVLLDVSENHILEPGRSEVKKLPEVDGSAALSYSVGGNRPFDIFYFVEKKNFEMYRSYLGDGNPEQMPSGYDRFTKSAVPDDGGSEYRIEIPTDGPRKPIGTSGRHYFVLDYTNYDSGRPVDQDAQPLEAFLRLRVVDRQFPI